MANEKYTSRNFYGDVINGNITDETIAYAKSALEKMDERNKKRASSQTASQKANEELKDRILDYMVGSDQNIFTAKEIAKALDLTSTQRATALLMQLVASEAISVEDYSPTDKKKDLVKGYSLYDGVTEDSAE